VLTLTKYTPVVQLLLTKKTGFPRPTKARDYPGRPERNGPVPNINSEASKTTAKVGWKLRCFANSAYYAVDALFHVDVPACMERR
jgi:hypothetical protein